MIASSWLVTRTRCRAILMGASVVRYLATRLIRSLRIRISARMQAAGHVRRAVTLGRVLRNLAFDQAGIEIPFPHVTVYAGAGKDGRARPFQLRPMGEQA